MPAVFSAPDPLSGSTAEHYDATCPDLMDRWSPVEHWVQARSAAGVLPYCKVAAGAPGRRMRGNDAAGRALIGVNFANDYSDGVRGTDAHRVGPRRLTASGRVDPKRVRNLAFVFFGLAAVAAGMLFPPPAARPGSSRSRKFEN